jgi:hypothetical protein
MATYARKATVLSAVLLANATPAQAGGDAIKVSIRSFQRHGDYGAHFTAVAISEQQAFPEGCKQLDVRARYAWWKWWWDDVSGRVSRRAQLQALNVLEQAAAHGDVLGFGYMGTGWHTPDASQPCRVVSHALVQMPDDPLPGTTTSVLSFFNAP